MKRILVIEDEQDLREALQTKLTADGYIVETVETSEQGLQSVLDEKPDLILLDVMTHSLHAETFLKRLRDLPEGKNDSKVIILTNLDNDITRDKVMKYTVDGYYVKAETPLTTISEKTREVLGI